MKKLKIQVLKALDYLDKNPTISISAAGRIFGADRHRIAEYKKRQYSFNNTFKNVSNPDDDCVYLFTEDELRFIRTYLDNPKKGFSEIQAITGMKMSASTLYHYLMILGEEKVVGKSRKYGYDRTKFSSINTEEDAYWLGFLTADGCVMEGRWVCLGLAEKDIGHLKKFCKYMGLTPEETEEIITHSFGGAYTRDNPTVYVKFCSTEIINNLEALGVMPRKSGKEVPYICSTVELEKAYVRGLIDGDGYLRATQYGIGIAGSYQICSYVRDFITKNIVDASRAHVHPHGTIFCFATTGRIRCQKIAEYLYGDANIYLDRKYDLYLKMYKEDPSPCLNSGIKREG